MFYSAGKFRQNTILIQEQLLIKITCPNIGMANSYHESRYLQRI